MTVIVTPGSPLKINSRRVFTFAMLTFALLSISTQSQAEWVEWIFDSGLEYNHHSNLNLSAFDADEESDSVVRLNADAGRYYQSGDRSRVRLSAGLEVVAYDKFDRLNTFAFTGKASLVHKLGIGPNVAWISPYLNVAYRDVKEDIRSGMTLDLGIRAGKRLSDRFDMSAGLAYIKGEGKAGVQIVPGISPDVFDQDRWVASLQGNLLLTNRLILLAAVSRYSGDFISACTVANVGTVLMLENVRAITLDSVFGGCVYRLNGDGNAGSIDLSYATSRHSSLSAGVSYLAGKGDVLDYDNTIFRASFRYSF